MGYVFFGFWPLIQKIFRQTQSEIIILIYFCILFDSIVYIHQYGQFWLWKEHMCLIDV